MHLTAWLEKLKGTEYLGDLSVDGRIILKLTSDK
jgi:hypothetical protein